MSLVAITTDAPEYDATLGPGDLWQALGRGQSAAACRAVPHHSVITGRRRDQRRTDRRGSRQRSPRSTRGLYLDGCPVRRRAGRRFARSCRKRRGVASDSGSTGRRSGANCRTDARAALRGRPPERDLDSQSTPAAIAGRGSMLEAVSVSEDGGRLAAVWSDATTPEEVWLGDAAGRSSVP